MVGGLPYLMAPVPLPQASTAFTTFIDFSSATSPKTTCFPSSHPVTTVVMKNWEPFLGKGINVCKAGRHVCWGHLTCLGQHWPLTRGQGGCVSWRSSHPQTSRHRSTCRRCPVAAWLVSRLRSGKVGRTEGKNGQLTLPRVKSPP